MGYYKFLSAQHIDFMVRDGTVRLSTLSYFRKLEGSRWIADPNEGSTSVRVKEAVALSGTVDHPSSEPWKPEGHQSAVKLEGNSRVTFKNTIFSYLHEEIYVFCFSVGDLLHLTKAMCRDAEDPYDSCVRVLVHPDILGHRILNRGTIVELGNRPAREYFSKIVAGVVTYDWREHSNLSIAAPPPSPFQKEAFFQRQSEYRLVLHPNPARRPSFHQLTVKLPHPEKVFAEEFREVPPL